MAVIGEEIVASGFEFINPVLDRSVPVPFLLLCQIELIVSARLSENCFSAVRIDIVVSTVVVLHSFRVCYGQMPNKWKRVRETWYYGPCQRIRRQRGFLNDFFLH